MFKNCILYTLTLPQGAGTAEDIAEVLGSRGGFDPCGPTQEKSCGWVPPRHEHGDMAESINGQLIAAFRVQTRSVPSAEIARLVDAAAVSIERTTNLQGDPL